MFKLRKAHMAAFEDAVFQDFEERAIDHLRTELPALAQPYDDGTLRQRIRAGIKRAAHYGLTTEHQLICFIDATFLLGERFDSDPGHDWALAILRHRHWSAATRADKLLAAAWDHSCAKRGST